MEGVRIAETADHPFSLALAYLGSGSLCLWQGDLDNAIAVFERGFAVCKATPIPVFLHHTAALLGTAYALAGRTAEALPLIEQAVELIDHGRLRAGQVMMLTDLSEAYLLIGRPKEAGRLAERAFALSRNQKERGNQAHALRLLGIIAIHRDPPDIDRAETHYRQALTLANELGMRPLQAHCHRGLGTLYSQIGQSEPARTELSTAIDMYRDMEMTFWLPEIEAALRDVEGNA